MRTTSQPTRETTDIVSWEDVERYVRAVADCFKDREFTGVYGLPRGGCTLAVMLSHAMRIPYLERPKFGCLIVDDISDSGDTLQFYKYNGYAITTMFYHKGTKTMPDYTLYEKGDAWVRFPWEVGDEGQ